MNQILDFGKNPVYQILVIIPCSQDAKLIFNPSKLKHDQ